MTYGSFRVRISVTNVSVAAAWPPPGRRPAADAADAAAADIMIRVAAFKLNLKFKYTV